VRFGKLAVPPLVAALRDREPGPQPGDAFGLSNAPGKFGRARLVAEALGLIGPDAVEAVPVLLELMQDRRGDTRESPVNGGDWQQLSPRAIAATALGRIGPGAKEAVPALLKMARDSREDVGLRLAAAEAAWRIDRADVLPVVHELLHGGLTRGLSAGSYSFIKELRPPGKELAPLLTGALRGREEEQPVEVLRLLAWLGPTAGPWPPSLDRLLTDPSPAVRAAAAVARWRLEGKGAAEAARALLDEFHDSPTQNRPVEIAATLGDLGAEARVAVPLLKVLLDDLNPEMRVTAAGSLWRISRDEKTVLPVLMRGLEVGDAQARRKAAKGLALLGPSGRPAAAVLKELLDDPENVVRAAAAEAMKKVQ
jgi:HEAT repeat protein